MTVLRNNGVKLKYDQKGIALLIFVIVISMASILIFFRSMSVAELKSGRIEATGKTLKNAKQALLAYAVTFNDIHPGLFGFLPCPDIDAGYGEGNSNLNCGSRDVNTIGRFPWASNEIEAGPLRSETGDCLWYAVSGSYKNVGGPVTEMLNEDTNGQFRVFNSDGINMIGGQPEERIVAVIIDPAQPVSSQSRSVDVTSHCGKDYVVADFLDGNGIINNAVLSGIADGYDDFIRGGTESEQHTPPFNDRIEVITREELWNAVTRRKDFVDNADSKMRNLTEALAICIAEYGNNSTNRRLPRPSVVDFSSGDYREDTNYDDTTAVSYLGRYPHTVDSSDTVMGVTAPVPGTTTLFNKGFCNSITLLNGTPVNLDTSSGSEYYKLWKNWKDHFFYAVSAYYAPTSSGIGTAPNCTGSNCISVGGARYAAAVIFANSRTGAQIRNAPIAGATDTKNTIANYLEVVNPAGSGSGDYTPTDNDIVYCIQDTDPLTVMSCP